MNGTFIYAARRHVAGIIAGSLVAISAGCSQKPSETPSSHSTNPPPSATTPIPPTANNATDIAESSNAALLPVFVAFCNYLNKSLASSNKLDIPTCSGVVHTSFSPQANGVLSASQLEVLGGAVLNKPGQFRVQTAAGQTRTFQFERGQIIYEYGYAFGEEPRWKFTSANTNHDFRAVEAQYSTVR